MQTKRIATIVTTVVVLTLLLATSSTVAGPPVERGQGSGDIVLADTVASKISYQGRLTDAGGNPLDGNYNLVFQLWDDASAGSQVWGDIVRNNVPVSNGLFTVELDMLQEVFNGRGLWLRIQVNGQWLLPRQELLPVPYALSLRPGATIEGDSFYGLSSITTDSYGLRGESSNPSLGAGVIGINTGGGGDGIQAVSNGRAGIRAWGEGPDSFGGYFSSSNEHLDLALGGNVGRINTDPDDENSQLYLSSNADVIIKLDNDGGEDHMLRIKNSGGNDVCTVSEGGTLTCTDATVQGTGIVGIAHNGANAWGVDGESNDGIGVRGRSENGYGGFFTSVNNDHFDLALGGAVGRINTDFTNENSQLYLSSNADVIIKLDNDGGENHVLRIKNSGGTDVCTINESGDLNCTGSKSAVVSTVNHGWRQLYAVESPEVWFEDFGTARLVDGEATVAFDPIFADTVNLEVDYHVFLTPLCQEPVLLFVTAKSSTGFAARGVTLDGQPASCACDYRVVARRSGYEGVRLEETTWLLEEDAR